MRVIIVGGTGTLGQAVVRLLAEYTDVVIAGHSSGDIKVDILDKTSIENMYKKVGKFDAVISTVGKVYFGPLQEMTSENYLIGLHDKVMGQVNLVLTGLPYINDNGSFTLTSGILSDDPIKTGSSAAMVNAAINGFVKGAAIEMPRSLRINAVSPTVFEESMDVYGDYFRGYQPIPAARAALAFLKSVDGAQTGQVYTVW